MNRACDVPQHGGVSIRIGTSILVDQQNEAPTAVMPRIVSANGSPNGSLVVFEHTYSLLGAYRASL